MKRRMICSCCGDGGEHVISAVRETHFPIDAGIFDSALRVGKVLLNQGNCVRLRIVLLHDCPMVIRLPSLLSRGIVYIAGFGTVVF